MKLLRSIPSACFGAVFLLSVIAIGSPLRAASTGTEGFSAGALRASLEAMAAKLTATLEPWPVPNRVFRIADFGALGDGKTVNTAAIQKAIDACSAQGGGVVFVEKGDYVTGTIDLKDGVMLEVAGDAKLLGSTNIADYPPRVPKHQTVMDTWMKLTQSLIYAEGCERVGIRGRGMIDGRGSSSNFPGKNGIGAVPNRPFLIRMIECRKVVLDGIHLRNAAAWMQNYLACDDLIFQGVNVENLTNWNNDGFDIDGCRNVIVRNCFVNSEDDGLCFKGASLRDMENVLVENSTIYSTCNAIKFGTDSQAGFRNVLIRNVMAGGPPASLPVHDNAPHRPNISGISWLVVDGGTVENILVENVKLDRTESPFCLRLGDRGRVKPDMPKPAPGKLRNLVFENIEGSDNGGRGSVISGIPDARIEDVVFRNIQLTTSGGATSADAQRTVPEIPGAYPDAPSFGRTVPAFGFWVRHADRITFEKVAISSKKPDARPQFVQGVDTRGIVINNRAKDNYP
jgi:polygalacturonase